MGLYRAKCLPTTLDIIARARRMKRNHPFLRAVYLLTDGEDDYSDEIRMWLLSEGWEHVWVGRRDVWPRAQDREVGVGVDMEVARRSGVFVGNGVSPVNLGGEHVLKIHVSFRRPVPTSSCCGQGMAYIRISRNSGDTF